MDSAAASEREETRRPSRRRLYAGVLLGLSMLLACDGVTNLLGILPLGFGAGQTMEVNAPVCGQWQVRPSPGIGFGRDFGEGMAVDALTANDVWVVGHAHDMADDTSPELLALHLSVGGLFSRVALADRPPDYRYSGESDLYFYDVK